jgi:hypothetical protein
MRAPVSAWTFPCLITALQPAGGGAQARGHPSRENRPWKIAHLSPRWHWFRSSPLACRPLPPSQQPRPSADIPMKTPLKRGQLD